ncbi:MAG: RNA 2'-phosphotransferase [Bacilli bacterium]
MDDIKLGKYLSYLLRHNPKSLDLAIDENGWVNVEDLIKAINGTNKFRISKTVLERIVSENKKKRFAFSTDKSKIRANQGHSIVVDVELKEAIPPNVLYHGTAEKYVDSIERTGLLPQNRLHVHLSSDIETALNVGSRHGAPVIYAIDAKKMHTDGFRFYLSENRVWLTGSVSIKYLKKMNVE